MAGLPPAAQLYVYYRVGQADRLDAVRAARALQQDLMARYAGLQCRLLERAEDAANSVTLMEAYLRDGGVDAALAQAIEQAAQARLGPLVLGARHVEVFVPCA